MPSDPRLIERLSRLLTSRPGIEPKRMFGGVCFMLRGNMCAGVAGSGFIFRVGAEAVDGLLDPPRVTIMDMAGRRMKGWVRAAPEHFLDDEGLNPLLMCAIAFAESLPPK